MSQTDTTSNERGVNRDVEAGGPRGTLSFVTFLAWLSTSCCVPGFVTWVRDFVYGDEAGLFHALDSSIGDYEALADGVDNPSPTPEIATTSTPPAATDSIPPVVSGDGVDTTVPEPTDSDSTLVPPVSPLAKDSTFVPPVFRVVSRVYPAASFVWGDFLKDGYKCIQWMLTIEFLFVPTKLLIAFAKLWLVMWTNPSTLPSTVNEMIIELISQLFDNVVKSLFPQIFLSLIFLYTGFFMGAKIFRNATIKFSYEVISLIMGVGAVIVVFFFLGADEWIWNCVVLVLFSIILGCSKLWDYFH